MFKFELGETAKDEITGFKGIITGRCDYITGCDQYMLQPKSIKSSEVPEPKWLDDNRLVIIKTTKKIKLPVDKKKPGACGIAPIK